MSSQIRVPERPDKEKKSKLPKIFVPALPDKPPLVIDGKEQILKTVEVEPGDVLMSSSTIEGEAYGYIPRLVRKLDQDWYSHAAFFDGEDVIESGLSGGVQRIDLDKVIDRNRYTDVYRFASDACRTEGWKSPNCRTIDHSVFPIGPLQKVANDYVGSAYATSDAVLAGLLALKRIRLTTSIVGSELLRIVIGVAITVCKKMAKSVPDKAALTCSELVYRIFNEAEPAERYRLIIGEKSNSDALIYTGNFTVQVVAPKSMASGPTFDIPVAKILSMTPAQHGVAAKQNFGLPDEFSDLIGQLRELADVYEQLVQPTQDAPATVSGIMPTAKTIRLAHNANVISPSDLRNSGNLREIGRLRKT